MAHALGFAACYQRDARITHELLYGTLHGALHVDYMWRRRQDFFAFGEHE